MSEHNGTHGRHCMGCAASLLRCEVCGKWYMSTAQRDTHRAKVHNA